MNINKIKFSSVRIASETSKKKKGEISVGAPEAHVRLIVSPKGPHVLGSGKIQIEKKDKKSKRFKRTDVLVVKKLKKGIRAARRLLDHMKAAYHREMTFLYLQASESGFENRAIQKASRHKKKEFKYRRKAVEQALKRVQARYDRAIQKLYKHAQQIATKLSPEPDFQI